MFHFIGMSLLTIKLRAKRRPRWLYVVSAILSLLASAFWAWFAHSALGFSMALARQVFIVFGGLSVSFCPLFYLANEKQIRDHTSKALIVTSSAFSAFLAAAVFYFIAKHQPDTLFTIVFAVVTIGLGVYVSLFAIKYEFE